MSWHFLPDVSGPGTFNLGVLATDNLETVTQFRALQVVATGTGTARLGGRTTVSASRGLPVTAPNGSQFLPWTGPLNDHSLTNLSVFVPAGCTLSIGYAY
jgi:hypothetical protein